MSELLCPKCTSTKYTILCLTSHPPQFEYQCNSCGHSLKYYERDNSYLQINQIELDLKSGKIKEEGLI